MTRWKWLGRALAALISLGVLSVLADGPPSAQAGEIRFDAYADRVLVNKYGGIQVEGWWDCTEQVEAAYPNPADRPDMVLASPNWDAYQFVGRTKVVHVKYESAIARPCYIKDQPGPYRWYTVSPFPDSHLTWMYSPDGKFSTGRIHVELQAEGGWNVGGAYDFPDYLYAFTQADLRAERAR